MEEGRRRRRKPHELYVRCFNEATFYENKFILRKSYLIFIVQACKSDKISSAGKLVKPRIFGGFYAAFTSK